MIDSLAALTCFAAVPIDAVAFGGRHARYARRNWWTVVDMKRDWKTVFPAEK